MSEGFTVQQQTEARARLAAATPGPWEVEDGWQPPQWDEGTYARIVAGEPNSISGIRHPVMHTDGSIPGTPAKAQQLSDAEFIAHAPTDLEAALDALDRVRALHTVEERCHDGSGEWSVTREQWTEGGYQDDHGDPEVFLICSHCGSIEMRESQGQSEFASYLDALWPCGTVRAIDGTPE